MPSSRLEAALVLPTSTSLSPALTRLQRWQESSTSAAQTRRHPLLVLFLNPSTAVDLPTPSTPSTARLPPELRTKVEQLRVVAGGTEGLEQLEETGLELQLLELERALLRRPELWEQRRWTRGRRQIVSC